MIFSSLILYLYFITLSNLAIAYKLELIVRECSQKQYNSSHLSLSNVKIKLFSRRRMDPDNN
jgi:hypothetical protein